MVLAKKSSIKLDLLSVYRVLFFIIISLCISNIYIYLLSFIILLFFNYKEAILYLLILTSVIFINNLRIDYFPYGIVEKKINNYYIVDKLLYKCKLIDNNLEIGDVVKTNKSVFIDDITYLKKNIIFLCKNDYVIYNFSIRNNIFNRIMLFDNNTKNTLLKFIYNINNYDDLTYNLGYGLAVYYLIKTIIKKNKHIGTLFLLIFSLFFYFDIKFYLLIIDIAVNDNKNNFLLKIIIILYLNYYLFNNYSILIPLLIYLYRVLKFNINFRTYLALISSTIFGYINILYIILFKYLIIFQEIMLVLSFFVIAFPLLSPIYGFIIQLYSFINNINLNIRGSLSFISFIIFIFVLLKKQYKISFTILILLLILPFNNPTMKISYIDVGQGDSTLIKLPLNQGNILIDTGSEYNYNKLHTYLLKQGIYSIDYLIITHNDNDHNGNLDNILNDFKVKKIIVEGEDININSFQLKYLKIKNFNNDNDNSLVYYTCVNGLKFLFTGDISSDAEKLFVNKYPDLKVDFLKVSHHGSKTATSNYFISNILPKYGIISTSGKYNHPSEQTIDILNNYLVKTFITKNDGNVEVYFNSLFNIVKTEKHNFVIIR